MKTIIIFTVFIFFSCGMKKEISHPNFSVIMNVGTGKVSYDLTFGFSPKATDGYDHGTDRYAPPPPPPVFFDAALWRDGERYYSQILKGDAKDLKEHVWDIDLQFSPENLIILKWNPESLKGLGSFYLQDAFDGKQINVDMTSKNTFQITNPTHKKIKLKVTPVSS
ncbi:MAG: hypothetical protein QGH24_01600 [Candidatus Marinimicrobia bacterium]|jgi:hypothetical protein|nr:hypothetical protein [Candidatus Neomarinimicrobiota bacterium]